MKKALPSKNLRIAVPYTQRRLASYPQDMFQSLKKSENASQIEINAEMHWQMKKKKPPKLEAFFLLRSSISDISAMLTSDISFRFKTVVSKSHIRNSIACSDIWRIIVISTLSDRI